MPRSKRPSTEASSRAEPLPARRRRISAGEAQESQPSQAPQAGQARDVPQTSEARYGLTEEQRTNLTHSLADEVIDRLIARGVIKPPEQPAPSSQPQPNAAPGNLPNSPPVVQECGVSLPLPPSREGEPRPEDVATTAVQALLYGQGESKPNTIDALISSPLGYHVNEKLREKIKNNQFVDFKYLLPTNRDSSLTLKVGGSAGEPTVRLASTTQARPITSIDDWQTAFNIYNYIYIQAHPQQAADLLKYSDIIRDLAKRFGPSAFMYYDENFRALREQNPLMSFSQVHSELWIKAATAPPRAGEHTFRGRPQSFRAPHTANYPTQNTAKGFCFKYNKQGVFCQANPCLYRHACSLCQGSHPRYRCATNNSPQQPNTSQTQRNTKSNSSTPNTSKSS